MVWDEGRRTAPPDAYPRVSVVTSPYATTDAALVPRVLRNDVTGYGFRIEPWVVGCGYAARYVFLEPSPGEFMSETMIMRLSDGYAWHLPDPALGPFSWRRPLAVTCDEVFALVDIKPEGKTRFFNVARIRLDALGPPEAPPPLL